MADSDDESGLAVIRAGAIKAARRLSTGGPATSVAFGQRVGATASPAPSAALSPSFGASLAESGVSGGASSELREAHRRRSQVALPDGQVSPTKRASIVASTRRGSQGAPVGQLFARAVSPSDESTAEQVASFGIPVLPAMRVARDAPARPADKEAPAPTSAAGSGRRSSQQQQQQQEQASPGRSARTSVPSGREHAHSDAAEGKEGGSASPVRPGRTGKRASTAAEVASAAATVAAANAVAALYAAEGLAAGGDDAATGSAGSSSSRPTTGAPRSGRSEAGGAAAAGAEESSARSHSREVAAPSAAAAAAASPSQANATSLSANAWVRLFAWDRVTLLHRPTPLHEGLVRCYVLRYKQGLLGMGHAAYAMHAESTDVMLLSCRKRGGLGGATHGSHLHFSLGPATSDYDFKAHPEQLVGKIKSEWSGSVYTGYDGGLSPEKAAGEGAAAAAGGGKEADDGDGSARSSGGGGRGAEAGGRRGSVTSSGGGGGSAPAMRRELLCAWFKYDSAGPGSLHCAVPGVDPASGRPLAVFQPHAPAAAAAVDGGALHTDRGLASFASADGVPLKAAAAAAPASSAPSPASHVAWLCNKRPVYDTLAGGYVLDFGGRVTEGSVKNFALAVDGDESRTVLQFGRAGKDRFILDFAYPLSPFQAFAIVMASLDPKMVDTRGFEQLRRMRRGSTDATSGAAHGEEGGSAGAGER